MSSRSTIEYTDEKVYLPRDLHGTPLGKQVIQWNCAPLSDGRSKVEQLKARKPWPMIRITKYADGTFVLQDLSFSDATLVTFNRAFTDTEEMERFALENVIQLKSMYDPYSNTVRKDC